MNVQGRLGAGFPVETAWEGASDVLHRRDRYSPGIQDPLQSSARWVDAFQVAELDRDSGRPLVRTHETMGAFRPVPSPDGRWLVYATRYESRSALKLLDLETGGESWLRMDVQRDDHQGGEMRY